MICSLYFTLKSIISKHVFLLFLQYWDQSVSPKIFFYKSLQYAVTAVNWKYIYFYNHEANIMIGTTGQFYAHERQWNLKCVNFDRFTLLQSWGKNHTSNWNCRYYNTSIFCLNDCLPQVRVHFLLLQRVSFHMILSFRCNIVVKWHFLWH